MQEVNQYTILSSALLESAIFYGDEAFARERRLFLDAETLFAPGRSLHFYGKRPFALLRNSFPDKKQAFARVKTFFFMPEKPSLQSETSTSIMKSL